jgi:hypothetical protein
MRAWALLPSFAASLWMSACAHDFGAFDPLPGEEGGAEEGGAAEGGKGKDSAPDGVAKEASRDVVPEGPCSASACLATAKTCGQTCDEDRMTCDASCHMSFSCRQTCKQMATTCVEQCVSTCTSCAESADCPAGAACQTAPTEGP